MREGNDCGSVAEAAEGAGAQLGVPLTVAFTPLHLSLGLLIVDIPQCLIPFPPYTLHPTPHSCCSSDTRPRHRLPILRDETIPLFFIPPCACNQQLLQKRHASQAPPTCIQATSPLPPSPSPHTHTFTPLTNPFPPLCLHPTAASAAARVPGAGAGAPRPAEPRAPHRGPQRPAPGAAAGAAADGGGVPGGAAGAQRGAAQEPQRAAGEWVVCAGHGCAHYNTGCLVYCALSLLNFVLTPHFTCAAQEQQCAAGG